MNPVFGFIFGLFWLIAVIAYVPLFMNFMALRSYAVTQGLQPTHAWKLFGEIWRDPAHEMHPALKLLFTSTVVFLVCVLMDMLVGMFAMPSALTPLKQGP